MSNFRPVDRETSFLLPPSVDDWLPEKHLARFVVEVVEKLGSEILLDVAVGSDTMVASVEPNIRASIHDRMRLALNPERLHFFDMQSEAAI